MSRTMIKPLAEVVANVSTDATLVTIANPSTRSVQGKRFFEQNAERLSHAAAVGAFKQLAAEEQKHIEFIQAQINALDNAATKGCSSSFTIRRLKNTLKCRGEASEPAREEI